tara:strand:+ start:219 stop:434 length:216 start_codon:yes stop_codon:yes gene_type:complete
MFIQAHSITFILHILTGQVGDAVELGTNDPSKSNEEDMQYMQEFLLCLAVCHAADAKLSTEEGEEEVRERE